MTEWKKKTNKIAWMAMTAWIEISHHWLGSWGRKDSWTDLIVYFRIPSTLLV